MFFTENLAIDCTDNVSFSLSPSLSVSHSFCSLSLLFAYHSFDLLFSMYRSCLSSSKTFTLYLSFNLFNTQIPYLSLSIFHLVLLSLALTLIPLTFIAFTSLLPLIYCPFSCFSIHSFFPIFPTCISSSFYSPCLLELSSVLWTPRLYFR